jgi:hypothetical protein
MPAVPAGRRDGSRAALRSAAVGFAVELYEESGLADVVGDRRAARVSRRRLRARRRIGAPGRLATVTTAIGARSVQAMALVARVVVAVWLAERIGVPAVVVAAAAVCVLAALRLVVVSRAGRSPGGSPVALLGVRLAAVAWLLGTVGAAVWAVGSEEAPGIAALFVASEVLGGVSMVLTRPLRPVGVAPVRRAR